MSDQEDSVPMSFTDPELRFLSAMWAGFKTIPELDMNKIGAQMAMNPRSCQNLWGQIKKKIMHNTTCSTVPAGNQKPATPAKRKRGKKDDDGSPEAKTARTPRGRGKKAADVDGAPAPTPVKGKGKTVKQEDRDVIKDESVDEEDAEDNGKDEDGHAEDAQAGEV